MRKPTGVLYIEPFRALANYFIDLPEGFRELARRAKIAQKCPCREVEQHEQRLGDLPLNDVANLGRMLLLLATILG